MKAWELLDSPEKWTTGVHARDAQGLPIDFDHPNACCWCVSGAVWKLYPNDGEIVLSRLRDSIGGGSTPFWNDHSDYPTVHAKLKELDI